MKTYEKYKDSGVEWLGEIPEHWEVKRLKYIFDLIQTGTTPSTSNENYFNGDVNWFTPKDLNDEILVNSERKLTNLAIEKKEVKLFPKDSILIVGIGATAGKSSYLSDRDSAFNQQITGFHSNKEYNKYFYYLFNSISIVMLKIANFTTLAILNNEFFKDLKLILPPLSEQEAIAKFLDEKTAKIDKAIGIKEKQIELLKERKQILIHDAVTQGLNKNVTFKDSGIDWIGKIPKHWEVKRLKYVADVVNGATPSSSNHNYWGGDIVWVTPTDINNIIVINESERNITKQGLDSCGTTLVPKGSIILTTRAPIGKLVIAGKELCTNQGCKSLILKEISITKYIYYLLSICSEILNSLGTGTTFMELSNKALKDFSLPIPPLSEQEAIAEYIETASQKIDKAVSLKQQEIEKLKEYKSSLINSVVTGKVRV